MGSAMGAGAGADMLQEVLKRKLMEQAQLAQQQQAAKALAENARQADQSNVVAQGHLGLGNRQLSESTRQFDAQAPTRMANVAHLGAETESFNRAPVEAQKARDFSGQQADVQRTFTGGQGDLNRGNAVKIAGMNGANALAVANVRHPDAAGAAAAAQQQNEVEDAIKLIDQLGGDPALGTAVGPIDAYVGKARDLGGVNRFEALHNQLVGKLSLAQAGKLKGQGQISDKERAMLKSAATALSRNLQEDDYKAELAKVREQFVRMQQGGSGTPAGHPPDDAAARAAALIKKYGGG